MDGQIDRTSNAPKSLYDKLRDASNQIIVKNRVNGLTLIEARGD